MPNLQITALSVFLLVSLPSCSSPLIDAARSGDTDTVKVLLKNGADVDVINYDGSSALMVAAYRGDTDIIKVLIEGGADVRMKDNFDWTPLLAAAEGNNVDSVKALIAAGAYIIPMDIQSALGDQRDNINPEIIILLENSSQERGRYKPKDKVDQPLSPVTNAKSINKALPADGADLRATEEKWGEIALIAAAMNGQVDTVKLLLDKGADVEMKEKRGGRTALIIAAEKGQIEVVRILLEKGANVNAKDKYGRSALMHAVSQGHIDTVDALLEKGADVNVTEKKGGETILITAAMKGRTEIVQKLLDSGAEVNKTDNQGGYALTYAARRGYANTVMALLNSGCDVNIRDKDDWTILMRAASKGHTVTVKTLLRNGADVNAKQKDSGWTALMAAAKNGHIDVVKVLLWEGADMEVKNMSSGWAALRVAELNDHKKIVRLFEKAKANPHKFIGTKSTSDKEVKKVQTKRTPPLKHPKEFPKRLGARWAVIIGISRYQDTRIPTLRYASADARAFYNWITSPDGGKYAPSRVKRLIDEDATAENIKNTLSIWLKQAIKEDMVTIYFAGHGSSESPDSPENLFLLPYDAQYDNIKTMGFPMWYIKDILKSVINAKRVVIIADASHTGGVGQPFDVAQRDYRDVGGPINAGLQSLSEVGDGICVISASGDKQLSSEGEEWEGDHGVFTHFLLKGLKGEADNNDDALITLGELIPFLSEQVGRETRNKQNPTVAGTFDPALSLEK